MRDIAITADVNVTLPVIAQAGSAAVDESELLRGSQKRASVEGTPGVAASSETVSHGGTRSWSSAIRKQPRLVRGCTRNLGKVEAALATALGFGQTRESGRRQSGIHAANAVWVAGPDRISTCD